jgi:hypothetical protein
MLEQYSIGRGPARVFRAVNQRDDEAKQGRVRGPGVRAVGHPLDPAFMGSREPSH